MKTFLLIIVLSILGCHENIHHDYFHDGRWKGGLDPWERKDPAWQQKWQKNNPGLKRYVHREGWRDIRREDGSQISCGGYGYVRDEDAWSSKNYWR